MANGGWIVMTCDKCGFWVACDKCSKRMSEDDEELDENEKV